MLQEVHGGYSQPKWEDWKNKQTNKQKPNIKTEAIQHGKQFTPHTSCALGAMGWSQDWPELIWKISSKNIRSVDYLIQPNVCKMI